MNKQQIREEIAACARRLEQLGLINLFEGNISVCVDRTIFITPSQQDKSQMTAEQILTLDMDGNLLEPSDYRPSSEWKMHREIYRLRPDAGAVVHHHGPFASAFAMAGKELDASQMPEALVLLGNIPVTDYGRPSTEDVYKDFCQYFCDERHDVLLLGNHGLVSVGADLQLACARAEEGEKVAKVFWLTRALGGFRPLPPGESALLAAYAQGLRAQAPKE